MIKHEPQIEDVDQVVINELKDAYLLNNRLDKVDCSNTELEPDYEVLKAIQTVLEYYMTAEELKLWNEKVEMIKHEPQIDNEKICKLYSEKDGVPVKYVCTSALGDETQAMDIFYRGTPHPEFGNRYFGIYHNVMSGNLMITNADRIEKQEFALVEDDDGNLQYSAHRHDYKMFENGNMIDGGRSYIKTSGCHVYMHVVRDGEMVMRKPPLD